jgi:two-component system, cell cycle sensor histidine kinase and response regulator CckA
MDEVCASYTRGIVAVRLRSGIAPFATISATLTSLTSVVEDVPALDQQLQRLLESFPGVVWATDRDLRWLLVFGSDLEALNLRPEDLVGTTILDFFKADDPDAPPIAAHLRALEGETVTYGHSFQGHLRQSRVEPARDGSGAVVGTVGMSVDVTKVAVAEAAVRQSEALTDAVVKAALDAVIIINSEGEILEFNPAAESIFGHARSAVVGQQLVDLIVPPSLRDAHRHGFARYLATGEGTILGQRLELSGLRADGSEFPAELTIVRVPVDGSPVFAGYIRDITPRIESAEALRRSEESYRLLFEFHPSPMWVYDLETLRFLAVNEAAVSSYGYTREEFLAMTIEQALPEEERPRLRETVQDPSRGRVDAGTWRHRKKDGTSIDVHVLSNAIEFEGRSARLVLAEDVTQQRVLEEQLRQAQKMEAVGNLAGGVAHDFNNILMVIRTCASLLLNEIPDEGLRDNVIRIDNAADRAAKLTRELLAFSRRQVLRPEITGLNGVVDETLELVRQVIGDEIDVVCEFGPELPAILVDRAQVEQVLINLAVNAREAMPEGGTLTIRTANVVLDEIYASQSDLEPGAHVLLQVSDTGLGMDEATRGRVFDPFYTTKDVSTGTGLGLATVYGIVKQSNGHIWLYSEPGRGTTFKIYFPVAGGPREDTAPEPEVPSRQGGETILLAEDDEAVRRVVAEALRFYGYTVVEACDGLSAIELAKEQESIDLVLTDVVMPGMTGRELVEQLLEERPTLKALFTSGYPADTVLRRGIAKARVAFIEKPYLPGDLALKVREVLDAPATGS